MSKREITSLIIAVVLWVAIAAFAAGRISSADSFADDLSNRGELTHVLDTGCGLAIPPDVDGPGGYVLILPDDTVLWPVLDLNAFIIACDAGTGS